MTHSTTVLDNGTISVTFDLEKGVFSVFDVQTREALLTGAGFGPCTQP